MNEDISVSVSANLPLQESAGRDNMSEGVWQQVTGWFRAGLIDEYELTRQRNWLNDYLARCPDERHRGCEDALRAVDEMLAQTFSGSPLYQTVKTRIQFQWDSVAAVSELGKGR